jgi:hypothetical protein
MIFFVATPLILGLMNVVVPLQLGARDVAYPLVNSLSFWLSVVGWRRGARHDAHVHWRIRGDGLGRLSAVV